MVRNIFVQSWLLWATFQTAGDHFYFIKSSLWCSQENTCWNLFLIKLQDWWPATLLERNPNTDFFLRISQNVWEKFFLWNTSKHYKIMATFCIKICMIQFLKDQMSSIPSDLYEEILKLNKSHANCIIQIIPCKLA